MAIEETQVGHQWEVKATGDDIPKLAGMLKETAEEGYKKAFHKGEDIGFEKVINPSGEQTIVRRDQLDGALQDGYRLAPHGMVFQVPELPWKSTHVRKGGRRRFKWDSETQHYVEV